MKPVWIKLGFVDSNDLDVYLYIESVSSEVTDTLQAIKLLLLESDVVPLSTDIIDEENLSEDEKLEVIANCNEKKQLLISDILKHDTDKLAIIEEIADVDAVIVRLGGSL